MPRLLNFSRMSARRLALGSAALLLLLAPAVLRADGGVTYTDIADGGGAGITYHRVESPRSALRQAIVDMSPIPIPTFFSLRTNASPQKAHGAPGVAILDYDGDGDQDIYVPNGPGAANSLYQNQLAQTGQATFVDVGTAAGVDATDQDSSGVCYGDIDNDGDQDLYVLGTGEANRLFENLGNGTFQDITASAGVAGDGRHAVACSFGDVNGDGFLDVVVANTYDDWGHRKTVFAVGPDYPGMEHNYLFLNNGDNTFTNVSSSSGIEDVSNMSGPGLTGGSFTWAIAMVDLDQDGAIDILFADNQGGAPQNRGQERGWLRYFHNDGTGHFTDITEDVDLDDWGGWMGLAFADLNCDSTLDFFASDLGYYVSGSVRQGSRWFLQNSDGTFTDSASGNLVTTPFGWGNSAIDYDNDGDPDIIFHGGIDLLNFVASDNPGILLRNDGACSADFSWDQGAILKDHRPRAVQGVATGDLNGDGFEDIVSVSGLNVVPFNFFPFVPFIRPPSGSAFDAVSFFEFSFCNFCMPGFQVYLDPQINDGTLAVELNSADNGNNWVKVKTVGAAGVLPDGVVNRDGIGALVRVTPEGGKTATSPVLGGASYGSENSLVLGFGLGQADEATVDVMWPGGVHNRLYGVHAGDTATLAEIPCDFTADWPNFNAYQRCVERAVEGLRQAGLVSHEAKGRYLSDAIQAYHDAHQPPRNN